MAAVGASGASGLARMNVVLNEPGLPGAVLPGWLTLFAGSSAIPTTSGMRASIQDVDLTTPCGDGARGLTLDDTPRRRIRNRFRLLELLDGYPRVHDYFAPARHFLDDLRGIFL